VKRIPEMNRLDYDERIGLRIGSAVWSPSILDFPPVCRLYPILADACGANPREDAGEHSTFGAILGSAASAADIAPALICLRASTAIFGPHGWSEMGVEALLAGSGMARIQPGEFVVDIRLPPSPPRSGGAYLRSPLQGAANQPPVGIAAFLALEEDRVTCCGARLVLGGVAGAAALRALETERFLAGKRLDDAAVREAAALAARNARRHGREEPLSGARLEAVGALTGRAILEAAARARAVGSP
jgi:carbon-monoxide dehydrogenase medium subunit